MTPVASLFVTLAVLHVLEGLFWIRRAATPFVRTWRGHRVARTDAPLGNAHTTFFALSPLPPLFEAHVVEAWPLIFGAEVLHLTEVERPPHAKPIHPETAAVSVEDALGAEVDGKLVRMGRHVVTTSSPITARALGAVVRRWAEASPDERLAVAEAALAARFDRAALQARLAELRAVGWSLRILSNLVMGLIFGGLYVLFFVATADVTWLVVLGALALALVATWIQTFRVHLRLYPGHRADRALKLFMMVVSFPAAARAQAWLYRDALAAFHPVAVAEALLSREALVQWVGPRWRDLRFPLAPDPAASRADVERARAWMLARYRAVLAEAGVEPASLEGAVAGVVAYCPRCRTELTGADGECPDCPGVTRVRGDRAAAA